MARLARMRAPIPTTTHPAMLHTAAAVAPAAVDHRLSWPERVEYWNAHFPKYPPIMYSHGWTYGVWYTGKGFTRNHLHGQYPPTFLRRVLGLWPDVRESRVLHACAGTVLHGIRLDLSPRFQPSVIANVETPPFLDKSFDLILYDPPYDQANADIYGVAAKVPSFARVLPAFVRLLPVSGHIGILHWYYPSYSRRKLGLKLVGLIAVCVGFCSATRIFSIFEKTQEVSAIIHPDPGLEGQWPESPK